MTRRVFLIVCLTLTGWGMVGCGEGVGYQLRGRVVPGPTPAVVVVDADDPRLGGPDGLSGAVLTVTLDPRSLGRKQIGTGVTKPDGTFEIPIEEFGAGFLEHEIAVLARAAGYVSAENAVELPSSRKRVLVILTPGRDRHKSRYTPGDDLRRYGY